jgi:hypothetical protein
MTSLDQARTAIQQGDKATAKIILAELVTHEPQNAAAWSLLAEVLDDPQQISFCRQRAQSIVQVEPPNTTKPMEPATPDTGQTLNSNLKKCPYCAETIKAEAIVCRFCGRDLRTEQALSTTIPSNQSAEPQSPLLDRQVEALTSSGWQVINRTPTTAQLKKPKQWSTGCLILFVLLPFIGGLLVALLSTGMALALFGVAAVGLTIAVLDYLLKEDETVYYTEEKLEQAEQHKQQQQREHLEELKRQEGLKAEQRRQREQQVREKERKREEERKRKEELRQEKKARRKNKTKPLLWTAAIFAVVSIALLLYVAFTTNRLPSFVDGTSRSQALTNKASDLQNLGLAITDLPSGFSVDDKVTGSQSNKVTASEVTASSGKNPQEFLAQLEKWGRIDGYRAGYVDTSKNPYSVISSITTMRSPSGAHDYFEYLRTSRAGAQPVSVPTFGDESFGTVEAVSISNVYRLTFRKQSVIATVWVQGYGETLEDVEYYSKILEARLSGKSSAGIVEPSATPIPMPTLSPIPQPTETSVPSVIGHMQCNREKTWIATSQSVLEEYLRANLEQGYQLTVQGKVFLVNCGASVKVIDRVQNTVEVQILEGEYKDRIGWTTTNFVQVP